MYCNIYHCYIPGWTPHLCVCVVGGWVRVSNQIPVAHLCLLEQDFQNYTTLDHICVIIFWNIFFITVEQSSNLKK